MYIFIFRLSLLLYLKAIFKEDPYWDRNFSSKIRPSLCSVKLILKITRILLILSQLPQAGSFPSLPLPSFILCQSHTHTQRHIRLSVLGSTKGQTQEGSLLCRDNALTSAAELSVPQGELLYEWWWLCTPHKAVSWQPHWRGRLFYKSHPVKSLSL